MSAGGADGGPLRPGETFDAVIEVSPGEVDAYVKLARIDNAGVLAEAAAAGRGGGGVGGGGGETAVPGRAILARIEGEMTRHPRMRGRRPLLAGADGDPAWGGRSVRFVRPLPAGERLHVRYTVSSVAAGAGGEGASIAVDFEGHDSEGRTVVVARRNLYRLGAPVGRGPPGRR